MGKAVDDEYRKQLIQLSFDFYQMWSFVFHVKFSK
jgi:hypothetical protein